MMSNLDKQQYEKISKYLGNSWPILFINSPEPICILDKDKNIILINKSFSIFIEYTYDELLSKTLDDIVYLSDVSVLDREINKLSSEEAGFLKIRFGTKMGKTIWSNFTIYKAKKIISGNESESDYVLIAFVLPINNGLTSEVKRIINEQSKKHQQKVVSKIFLFLLENWKSLFAVISCIIGLIIGAANAMEKMQKISETQIKLEQTQQELIQELQKINKE